MSAAAAKIQPPPYYSAAFPTWKPPLLTEEEYEEILADSTEKLEFCDGLIIGMAGGDSTHSLIKANTVATLRDAFRKRPCRVYDSDMKVRVEETGMNAFPDAVVVCGKPEFQDDQQTTLENPNLIVEVLSKTTEAFDRGRKFWNYRHLKSLHTYVLISTERPLVDVYELNAEEHWQIESFDGTAAVMKLNHFDLEIPLNQLYEKTAFDPTFVDSEAR